MTPANPLDRDSVTWRELAQARALLGADPLLGPGVISWAFKRADGSGYTYRYSVEGAPAWLDDCTDADPEQCITALAFGPPEAPPGYRPIFCDTAGEVPCPNCSGAACERCEGRCTITWGEDWSVVVFAPRYTYGSGMAGCLYDYGPHGACSVADATDALARTFAGYFEAIAEDHGEPAAEAEERYMRECLAESGHFYFTHPELAGATYCAVDDLGEP